MLKIAAAHFIQTSFCLVLDADLIGVCLFGIADLVQDGKGMLQMETEGAHLGWYEGSRAVLRISERSHGKVLGVTPRVLSVVVSLSLQQYLSEQIYPGEVWTEVLNSVTNIRSLARKRFSTEFALYYEFCVSKNLLTKYHFLREEKLGQAAMQQEAPELVLCSYAHSVWTVADALLKRGSGDPADLPGIFLVYQSHIGARLACQRCTSVAAQTRSQAWFRAL